MLRILENRRGSVRRREPVPPLDAFARAITGALHENFGNHMPAVLVEPGRAIVAEAGVMQAEVVLVSRKDAADVQRWVYLDVGMFTGLAETMGEAIRYRFVTDRDRGAHGPVILAGPTCDGADILYEHADYRLPLDLRAGDRVRIPAAGAYTTPYAAQHFNGIRPMAEYYI